MAISFDTITNATVVVDTAEVSSEKLATDAYVTLNTDALTPVSFVDIPASTTGTEIKNIQLGSTTYPINLPSNANANVNCVTTNALIIQKSSNPVLTINNKGYLTTNEGSLKITTNSGQTQITENGIFYNTHKAVVGGMTSMLANVPYMIDFDIISTSLSGTSSATVNVYASAFNMSRMLIVGVVPYSASKPYYNYYVSSPTTWTLTSTAKITFLGTSTTTTTFNAKLMVLVMGY